MSTVEETGAHPQITDGTAWAKPESRFSCKVFVLEEDSEYSVFAADLPGVVSQGDTINDALENIREALEGALAEYLDDGGTVPWSAESMEKPRGAIEFRLTVNV